MSANWPWVELGLDAPAENERAVRRAYAARLRAIDLETDIAGFEALRLAYQNALWQVASHVDRSENAPDILPAREVVPTKPAPRVEEQSLVKADVTETTSADMDGPFAVENWQILASIAQVLSAKNYAVETWQELLSDISSPETKIAVERLIVGALKTKPRHEAYPPLEWLRIVDARYEWVTDGVGFIRRHPAGGGLLDELVELLGAQEKNPFQLHGRPVPIFLRWRAILAYTVILFICRLILFV